MNKWAIALTLLLAGGCASDGGKSISYYHFDIEKAASLQHAQFDKPRLEIIPIIMPDHLNAKGLAQRVNRHRTVNANWHLWSSKPGTMLERFNGGLNNNAEIIGSWTLLDAQDQLIMRQNFSQSVTLQDDGYDGLTAALQAGWEAVCESVAGEIGNGF